MNRKYNIIPDSIGIEYLITRNTVHSTASDSYHDMNIIAQNDKHILQVFSGYNPLNFVVTKRNIETGQLVAIAFPDGTVKSHNPIYNDYAPTQNAKIYDLGFRFMVYNIRTLLKQHNICNRVSNYLSYMPVERKKHRPTIYAIFSGLQSDIRRFGDDVSIHNGNKLSFRYFNVPEPHQIVVMPDGENYTDIIVGDMALRMYTDEWFRFKRASLTYRGNETDNFTFSLWPDKLLLQRITMYYKPRMNLLYDKYGRNTGA